MSFIHKENLVSFSENPGNTPEISLLNRIRKVYERPRKYYSVRYWDINVRIRYRCVRNNVFFF